MWNPVCLSTVLSGEAGPKGRTRRARFYHRLLRNMLPVFLTPCESDAKSYGCDIFHSRTRVICYRVSTALTYTFAGPLSLKQNGVFTHHTASGCTDEHTAHSLFSIIVSMFALSMSWAVGLSDAGLSGGEMWIAGSSRCVVCRHWAFKQNSGYSWFVLRFCGTTRFWALPAFTYIVVRSPRMNGCMGADIILQLLCAH